jgi:hypothetical protein
LIHRPLEYVGEVSGNHLDKFVKRYGCWIVKGRQRLLGALKFLTGYRQLLKILHISKWLPISLIECRRIWKSPEEHLPKGLQRHFQKTCPLTNKRM